MSEELTASLLHEEPQEPAPRRWAYPSWGMVLVSLFVAFHAVILLVWNLPASGLTDDLHRFFDRHLQMRNYLRTVGSTQSWRMFAPNPHRKNYFMRVYLIDAKGDTWDMQVDLYQRRRYPYVFYDRMGKINRRIVDERQYRRHFAAWVCRHWEATHGGESGQEVRFVRLWTKTPDPQQLFDHANGNLAKMWFDLETLPVKRHDEGTVSCESTRQAQLPPYLRERLGLPPADETHYRPVFIRTWKDKQESEQRARERAERKKQVGQPPVEREVFQ